MKEALLLTLLALLGMFSWKFLFDRTKKGEKAWLILTVIGLIRIAIWFFDGTYDKLSRQGHYSDEFMMVDYILFLGIVEFLLMLVIGIIWYFSTKKLNSEQKPIFRKTPKSLIVGAPILFVLVVILLFVFKVDGGITSKSESKDNSSPISDSKTKEHPSEDQKEEITVWSIYKHTSNAFTISIPSSARVKETEAGVDLLINLEQGSTVKVIFGYRRDSFNLDTALFDRLDDLSHFSSGKVVESKKIEIEETVFTYIKYVLKSDLLQRTAEFYTADLDTSILYLQTESNSSKFEDIKSVLDEIIYSFKPHDIESQ